MKVIYLHQYFNTPDMSGGTRSYELGRRLVHMGHEVHMVTSWREPDGRRGWFTTNEAGMTVHWLPVPYSNEMGFAARIRAFLLFAVRSSIYATRLDGDVVFATSTPLTIAIPGIIASKLRRRPMVFEVRDLWPEVPIALGTLENPYVVWLARKLERIAYQSSKRVIALAPGMADHVIAHGTRPDDVVVIPNGCDFEFFDRPDVHDDVAKLHDMHPWLRALDGPLVVYLGTIGGVNDVAYVVRVAHEFKVLGVRVTIAVLGDGKERTRVEALASRLQVYGTFVRFLGKVPKQDIPAWLAMSSGSFVTIDGPPILYRNGVLNKFFDTLAAGKPALSNFDGFASRLAVEHDAGLILHRDPRAAACELANLLASEERVRNMGLAARRLAEDRFDRNDQARNLNNVLSSACHDV